MSWLLPEELREPFELAVAANNWIESSGDGSWQLADDGGIESVQLRVESPAVKRSLYVCCSTVIIGVCDSVRLL
jgi:hypothetical protein